jgi:hypothetical protein
VLGNNHDHFSLVLASLCLVNSNYYSNKLCNGHTVLPHNLKLVKVIEQFRLYRLLCDKILIKNDCNYITEIETVSLKHLFESY